MPRYLLIVWQNISLAGNGLMKIDVFSFLGISIAFAALLGGNFLEGGSWQQLLNGPAALIVFGGTIGAAILQTPLYSLRRALQLLSWIFFPPETDPKSTIKKVSSWAKISRRQGLLGLDNQVSSEKDPYIRKALQLLVDEGSPQTLRRVLETDLVVTEQRDLDAANFYSSMGGYAPTIGIIGAVMGLIYVMRNLNEPSELGLGIAVAFVATIYGIAVANLLLLPIANKLTSYIYAQSKLHELIIEGSVYVAEGENPRSIELKLSAYLD